MDSFCTKLITFVLSLFTTSASCQSNKECENCGCCDAGKDLCLYQNLSCTTCLDGYWGAKCRNVCPANCLACSKDSVGLNNVESQCTKCEHGQYLHNDSLRYACRQCPYTCKTCTARNNCKECKTGYYMNNRCVQCNRNCTACLSREECTACISVHFGENCEQECSVGCQDDVCDKRTGACSCKTGFTGQKCDRCIDTFYGQNCHLKCLTTCKEQICSRENGLCERCVAGWYGKFCNQSCSRDFKSGICERENGKCIDECLHTYADKSSKMVTFDEFVKKTALAVVVTFILTLCLTAALQCFLRFFRRRRVDRNRHTEEQTADSYATIRSVQTNTERDNDVINRDNDYLSPIV